METRAEKQSVGSLHLTQNLHDGLHDLLSFHLEWKPVGEVPQPSLLITLSFGKQRIEILKKMKIFKGKVEVALRGGELRAIEAQQAIRALIDSRVQYLRSVIEYNQSQFELMRAIGQAPQVG